jgi:nicotinamide riboside kinase
MEKTFSPTDCLTTPIVTTFYIIYWGRSAHPTFTDAIQLIRYDILTATVNITLSVPPCDAVHYGK